MFAGRVVRVSLRLVFQLFQAFLEKSFVDVVFHQKLSIEVEYGNVVLILVVPR